MHARIIASLRGSQKSILIALGLAALSLIWKGALLAQDAFPFNADEAIVGLMARHILQGEWPTFFYGQAYMGSLDATLVAGAFAAFGPAVGGIRLVQALLYAATIYTSVLLAYRITKSRSVALYAGLLLAVPTVNVTLYTTVSLGGYGEALLLGNLLMLLTLDIVDGRGSFMLWGLAAGLGFWAFGITLIYILPGGWFLLRHARRRWSHGGRLLVGFLLGCSPWWLWALRNGLEQLLQELLGSAIAGASSGNVLQAMAEHLRNLALFAPTVLLGIRPPWSVTALAVPLIPIVVLLWAAMVAYQLRTHRSLARSQGGAMLLGVSAALLVGFVATPFGADPSGRYFVPLAVPLAIFMADFLGGVRVRLVAPVALLILLLYNVWGTLEAAAEDPPGLTTQFNQITQIDHAHIHALAAFLQSREERFGYSNYWVSYPLAFISGEELVFVPKLPYHSDFRYTDRDDRYEPYSALVAQASQTAYITTFHPELDAKLRDAFAAHEVTWEEQIIGDYHVYYALSAAIRPADIGLRGGGLEGP